MPSATVPPQVLTFSTLAAVPPRPRPAEYAVVVLEAAAALVLADRLMNRFRDGQIFLKLEGTSPNPLKPADAMAQVIRAFRGAVGRVRRVSVGRGDPGQRGRECRRQMKCAC